MTTWRGLATAVYAPPIGRSTAARLALTAGEVGYDTVVLRNGDALDATPTPGAIAELAGVDLVHGIELREGDIDTVSGRLPHLREETTLLLVTGGSTSMNRFIASQPHVDVLTDPVGPDGPDLDPGVAAAAEEHDVAIELDLGLVRTTAGGRRVRSIDRLRRLWRLVDHYDLPYVVSMGPTSHLEVVPPREVAALADCVGIDPEAARTGLAAWRDIAARNRERYGGRFFDASPEAAGHEADDR